MPCQRKGIPRAVSGSAASISWKWRCGSLELPEFPQRAISCPTHPVTFADGERAALQGPSSNAYVWIELTNNCSTTKKVKIVISWGGDCWTLRPGAGRSWTYDGLGDYDKTVLC